MRKLNVVHLFALLFCAIETALSFEIGTLVVGGVPSAKAEFPFIVSLRINNRHICGGSIISAEWIVTAAHCAVYSESLYTVVAGEYNLNVNEGTEQSRTLVKIVSHPNYNPNTMANDIALMKVTPKFNYNVNVQPATTAPKGFGLPVTVTVAGWGYTKEGGSNGLPNILQKVDIPVVPNDKCRRFYYNLGSMITDSTFCAGSTGKDSCQGDSGGPVIAVVNNKKILTGIVSWGVGCARPNLPGVNTRVSSFQDWMATNAKR